jgi:DNA-binding MarR family transcriptional regulator
VGKSRPGFSANPLLVARATIFAYTDRVTRTSRPLPHECPGEASNSASGTAEQLRASIQRFVRSFGLLATDQTPCGTPISASYAHALVVLLERGHLSERSTQQELGAALGIDKSNVARLCAKLQRAGHATQQRSATDGRARLLALTASGRRLAERVQAASRDRFKQLFEALPSDETRSTVLTSLEALNSAINTTHRLEKSK